VNEVSETTYILALQSANGIGNVLLKQLVSYCGSAREVFNTQAKTLEKIPGIGVKLSSMSVELNSLLPKAESQIEKVGKYGGEIIPYTSALYPIKLRQINDCPAVLYSKGNWDTNNPRVISIVGTRSATDYGKKIVEEILDGIKKYNPLVVSGLAYGIDIHAHKIALKSGLQTVGVLGSGLDVIYPKLHAKIASKMVDQGGLITELPLGTKPDAPHFPMRNRIIAGMSDAVIVVEAAEKGGALITAELASGYGRDVFAIPGNLHSSFSEGCNKLIRNHTANILTSPDDIPYLLNWPEISDGEEKEKEVDISNLAPEELRVYSILSENQSGLQIDNLAIQTKIELPILAGILLNLEFLNKIISLPGKIYKIR